jgi:hypothetical protein
MPGADFYAGLPLAEKLRKLVDHHYDRRVRHISQDEASILYDAVGRLEAGVGKGERRAEFDANWRRLEHVYTTRIAALDGGRTLLVVSVPSRSAPMPPRPKDEVFGLRTIGVGDANPRNAQLALNVLLWHSRDKNADLESLWADASKRRSPPDDPHFEAEDNELLNRALYQPTVAVESSPPSFMSLSEAATSFPDGWISVAQDPKGVISIAVMGGMVLVFKLLKGPTEGLSQGLRERLYEWARPKPGNDDPSDDDAVGSKRSTAPPPGASSDHSQSRAHAELLAVTRHGYSDIASDAGTQRWQRVPTTGRHFSGSLVSS